MERKGYRSDRGTGAAARPGAARASRLLFSLLLTAAVGAAGQVVAQTDAVGTGDMRWTDYDSQPLRVNIWQGRAEDEIYQRGEAVKVAFEANQDAYAVVYRIDADGEVTILWPRSRLDDGFVFGGQEYGLPMSGAPRLRAGPEAGVEYVEALVSLYPFDLRDLEVDFHSEPADEAYHYAVAGDPFLAMNEVNHAITRLENAEDFVVTNYISYNVDQRVDHPRYLCNQCHTDGDYDPYGDRCVIAIHHDYGWSNRWYVRFGYYPVYSYPAYYYVDPWSSRPWINYWYTPWYDWPGFAVYDWPFDCHIWNYSPYWRGDCWTRWKSGDRRYVPLDKRDLRDERWREKRLERSVPFAREPRPSREVQDVLRTRTKPGRDVALRQDGREAGRGGYRDVGPDLRAPVVFPDRTGRGSREPGLQVRDGRGRGERVLSVTGDRARGRNERQGGAIRPGERGNGSPERFERGDANRVSAGRGAIRPLTPRKPGTRIWSGGRSGAGAERDVRPAPESRRGDSGSRSPTRGRDQDRLERRDEGARVQPSRRDAEDRPTVRSAPERSGERSAPAATATRGDGKQSSPASSGKSQSSDTHEGGRAPRRR